MSLTQQEPWMSVDVLSLHENLPQSVDQGERHVIPLEVLAGLRHEAHVSPPFEIWDRVWGSRSRDLTSCYRYGCEPYPLPKGVTSCDAAGRPSPRAVGRSSRRGSSTGKYGRSAGSCWP